MSLALWRSPLAHALHRNRSLVYSRYVQLATVRSDGRPANRTIVFRGFLDDTNQLKFITDRRSDKIDQIAAQAWGEVCWYFPKTREQFRLLGNLILVGEQHADVSLLEVRQRQWQEISEAARSQFIWPDPAQSRSDAASFNLPAPDPITPVSNFCLLLLDPIQVDHLELRGEPQNRYLYFLKEGNENEGDRWVMQQVNP